MPREQFAALAVLSCGPVLPHVGWHLYQVTRSRLCGSPEILATNHGSATGALVERRLGLIRSRGLRAVGRRARRHRPEPSILNVSLKAGLAQRDVVPFD